MLDTAVSENAAEAAGNPLQRTAAWFRDRCGCLTASRCYKALNTLKSGKPAASREEMIMTLICERLTGSVEETFTSAAMQWGTDHEAEARDVYEEMTGHVTDLVGFVRHPDLPWFGASPDALVDDDGLLEIKCPTTGTHLSYLEKRVIPEQYRMQMLAQLICTGRTWCDFMSYDPRIKVPHLRVYIERFEPSQAERDLFLTRVTEFLAEVEARYHALSQE